MTLRYAPHHCCPRLRPGIPEQKVMIPASEAIVVSDTFSVSVWARCSHTTTAVQATYAARESEADDVAYLVVGDGRPC